MIGVSFIRPDFYDELTSIRCDYLIKHLTCVFLVILSDKTVDMGDTFCYFPLYAASISFFFGHANETSRRRLGKDVLSFAGERRP